MEILEFVKPDDVDPVYSNLPITWSPRKLAGALMRC